VQAGQPTASLAYRRAYRLDDHRSAHDACVLSLA
jgi:hypothetical protein